MNKAVIIQKHIIIGVGAQGTYFLPMGNVSYATKKMAEAFAVEQKEKYPQHFYYIATVIGDIAVIPRPNYALREW